MLDRWTAPATEAEARVELAAAYRYASDLGWTDLGATHFSLRVPGEPDAYLMLREGLFFNDVTASNLVKLDLPTTNNPVTPDIDTCRFTKKQQDLGHGYMYRDWTAIVRDVERNHPDYSS